MDRLTMKINEELPAVPVNFALDFILDLDTETWHGLSAIFERLADYEDTGMSPEQTKHILSAYARTFGKGVSFDRIQELIRADREERLLIVPRPGSVLFEIDGEHGIVTHKVTDVHWMANTVAVDDKGMEWADYYTDEEIHTAFTDREAAEDAMWKAGYV